MVEVRKIDVLISTFGQRIAQLDNILKPEKDNVRYIICHQNFELFPPTKTLLERADVKYIRSSSIGVTKSRNILLKVADGDIIYFCDDDVTLSDDFDKKLIEYHSLFDDNVILFNIKDEFGEFRKRYSSVTLKKNRFSILSVGTIEISLKNEAVVPLFPEDIGAGTSLPIGDEAIFLSKLLDISKSIRYVPYTIAVHPKESTGLAVTFNSVYSRGVTLRRVYGLGLALPLGLVFFIRRRGLFSVDGGGAFKAGIVFLKGILRGK